MSEQQTNTNYLFFASDTEAQLNFNDEIIQRKYSEINKQKRAVATQLELINGGFIKGDVNVLRKKLHEYEDQLIHIQQYLCEDMNTYVIGYAPIYRGKTQRYRKRDKKLKHNHIKHNHKGEFESCIVCHQLEKSEVHYFIEKSIKKSVWIDMFEEMNKRYDKLIRHGSKYTALLFFHNLNYDIQSLLQVIVDDTNKLFTNVTCMNSNNAWYSLKFEYKNHCYELRDSFKLYTQKLANLAKLVHWEKLTEQATYEWFDLNNDDKFNNELEYFIYDINILVHVMEMHFDKFGKTRLQLTMPGYAEKELKACVRQDDDINNTNNYYKIYDVYLSDKLENYIRKAYYGGFVYANKDLISKELHSGITADVNSLYPSVMLNRNYPDIHSLEELKEEEFNKLNLSDLNTFAIVQIAITDLKLKDNSVPCMPKKCGFGVPKDVITFDDIKEPLSDETIINITTLDLYHILKNYEIKYRFVSGVIARKYIDKPFKTFVLKHKKEKEEATKAGDKVRRLIAKLMLNSSYGKFAQKNIDEEKRLTKDEDGLPSLYTVKKEHDENKKRRNILIAVFVTAFARDVLLTTIENINKSDLAEFWYCDTDSVHFGYLGDKDYINDASQILEDVGIPFDTAEFGKWKDEQYMQKAKYLGSKRYWEYDPVVKQHGGDPNIIKGAGIQQVGKDYLVKKGLDYFSYDNYHTIWVPFKVSKKVHGGIKIYMDYKEIKASHWQYKYL